MSDKAGEVTIEDVVAQWVENEDGSKTMTIRPGVAFVLVGFPPELPTMPLVKTHGTITTMQLAGSGDELKSLAEDQRMRYRAGKIARERLNRNAARDAADELVLPAHLRRN